MSRHEDHDRLLDAVLESIRSAEPDPARAEAARRRVSGRLFGSTLDKRPSAAASRPGRPSRRLVIAAAAGIVVAALGLTFLLRTAAPVDIARSEPGTELWRLGEAALEPVAPGEPLATTVAYRIGPGGPGSIVLDDGTRIELAARSAFRLERRRRETTLALARGRVIVEAADQHPGHLHVRTPDLAITVTGTVFSVASGTSGSRVGVLEGEVEVASDGTQATLGPGEQLTSRPEMPSESLAHQVAWSRRVDRYLGLLEDVDRLGRELEPALVAPRARVEPRLLRLAPPSTTVYVALPNVAKTMADVRDQLAVRIADHPALAAWWREHVPEQAEERLGALFDGLRMAGDALGDEIVLAIGPANEREPGSGFVLLAEVRDRQALGEVLERLDALGGSGPGLASEVIGETLVLSSSADLARRVSLRAEGRDSNSTDDRAARFAGQIERLYRDGVQWVIAVDIARIVDATNPAPGVDADPLLLLGIRDADMLLVRGDFDERSAHHEAVLTFRDRRRGLASWLGEPQPMGSLDFISTEAVVAGAAILAEPQQIVAQDLLPLLRSGRGRPSDDENSKEGLEALAGALGRDVSFSIEPPLLPRPSWLLVLEVYDPGVLDRLIEESISGPGPGSQRFVLEPVAFSGLPGHRLVGPRGPLAAWTDVDGYRLIGSDPQVVAAAIERQRLAAGLGRSPRLLALWPARADANASALVYENLSGSLASMIAGLLPADSLTEQQRARLARDARSGSAGLSCAFAESDRIEILGTREGGFAAILLDGLRRGFTLLTTEGLARRPSPTGEAGDR